MAEPTSCCVEPVGYGARVDTLFNMAGIHVLDVAWARRRCKLPAGLRLIVESELTVTGCPGCGVVAVGHGRRVRQLHDIPAFGAPVELVWQQRRYRCAEPACPVVGFSEDHPLAAAQAKLTRRAVWWAISCIQQDTASVQAVARRPGVDWHTVCDAIRPLLAELADDPDRLTGVDTVGVDDGQGSYTADEQDGQEAIGARRRFGTGEGQLHSHWFFGLRPVSAGVTSSR
jgi:transposase